MSKDKQREITGTVSFGHGSPDFTALSLNPQSIYLKHTNTFKYLHPDPPGLVHHHPAVPAGLFEVWELKTVSNVNMIPKSCMSVREDEEEGHPSIAPDTLHIFAGARA